MLKKLLISTSLIFITNYPYTSKKNPQVTYQPLDVSLRVLSPSEVNKIKKKRTRTVFTFGEAAKPGK